METDLTPSFGEVLEGITYVDRPGAYGFLFNSSRELAVIQTNFGYFLPGGGVELGESDEQAMEREFLEEIGYKITGLTYMARAIQFHWSEFYQQYFRKNGSFYQTTAIPTTRAGHGDHTLLWLPPEDAVRTLSQEFQRWAIGQVLKGDA